MPAPTSVFPATATRPTGRPQASRETHDAARRAVRDLLQRSEAFAALDDGKRRKLANDLVNIGAYLAEPDGMRLAPRQHSAPVRALADPPPPQQPFGQALRTGVEQAGALLQAVNFPQFVSGLISGVFHSIVTSSIEQMEAYAKLVADVSKSLDEFRDDNTTQNQGRDHLVEQFPDTFQLTTDTGDFSDFDNEGGGTGGGPRVTLREGVDESAALAKINRSLPLDKPLTELDNDLVEALLVPAARTQIATGRQQLLATMILMGINRIVVTDGKISAKVMYDFTAKDNTRFQSSATSMDHERDRYGNLAMTRTPMVSDAQDNEDRRNGSYYAKGTYKYAEQPVVKLVSASNTTGDATLNAKANLMGQVEVNFKSDFLPLDKMADPKAIAAIQGNAQPGMLSDLAKRQTAGAPAAVAPPTAPPTAAPVPAR